MNYKIIAIEVLLIIICTVIAYLLSNDKPTAALTSLSTALAALSVLVSASSAEDSHKQTEKILKLTETEQRKKDINERLKYFYLPIKDILEPNCALLKENHTRYNNPTEIYIDNFAGMFDKKMESLKNEYIEEYRNPNSIEIIKIKHSSAEESNNLLIHLITIKEIKKNQTI